MRSLNAVFLWPLFLVFLLIAVAAPAEKLTFIHTASLGDVFAGVSDDPLAPLPEETERTLLALKSKHPEAFFIDSGNFHGPRSLTETQYAMDAMSTLDKLDPVAVNYGSRDMIYESYVTKPLASDEAAEIPFVSLAEFPHIEPDSRPEKSISGELNGTPYKAIGLARPERMKKNLKGWPIKANTETQSDYLRRELENANEETALFILLSDLHPRNNDRIAEIVPPNTIMFEQSVYGVNPEDRPESFRRVNGIPIVSKTDWWTADIVTVEMANDGAIELLEIDKERFNPWFRAPKPSLFKRLFSLTPKPPRDRELQVERPRLAQRVKYYFPLRKLNLGEDEILEFRAENVPGAKDRLNENVYYYRLLKDNETLGDFMRFYHTVVKSNCTLIGFASFDREGTLIRYVPRGYVQIHQAETRINDLFENKFSGMKLEEIQMTPEEAFGVEHQFHYLLKDLKAIYEIYPQALKRGKQVTDPYDLQDF